MARLSAVSLTLLGLEFFIATATMILFGLAYPDRFRSLLWENGGEEGWNSNPNKRIYFYANHVEPPEIPLIWSQRLTDSNLAIAILSFVIFFARAIMTSLNYLPRFVNILYDILLTVLWISSLAGQTSGDYSDVQHPSAHPWYLTHSCSDSWVKSRGYCRIAQASLMFSVLAAVLYGGRLLREAMLFAYQRGKQHGSGWTAIDQDAVIDLDEEKYSDINSDDEAETEGSTRLTINGDRYDPGLSPVLAFFPSGRAF